MLREGLKALGLLALCLVVGLAGGLLYGLVLSQVEYVEVDPEDLAQTYKEEYLRLIAADYAQTRDLPLAQQRLRRLGFEGEVVRARAEAALFERAPGAGALARLAADLGLGSERIQAALVSPTATHTPSATPTLTPTTTPVATRRPTRTPVPTEVVAATVVAATTVTATATIEVVPTVPPPTATRAPTRPPATATLPPPPASPTLPPATAVPATTFEVRTVRMLSIQENGGCEGLHNAFVTVLDAAGNPLNGVTVALRWDTGQDVKVTGYKPQFLGQVDFDLYGGYHVQVLNDVDGSPARSEVTPLITSHYPSDADLIAAGYCADVADCEFRRAQSPPQLCYGHYSWEVVFQRTR